MNCHRTPTARCFPPASRLARRGFTLIELLVAMVIIGLILACVVPYVMAVREVSHRQACADNLRVIRSAMASYNTNYGSYPRVRYEPQSQYAWTCFTGPDETNPFSRDSAVQPNDVTASLWWLVHEGYIVDTSYFVCPSTSEYADPLTDATGKRVDPKQRGNFRSNRNLSYSILSPFNPNAVFVWSDTLPPETALLADQNPGIQGSGDDVTRPAPNDPPEVQALANSNNHSKVGQNVLYADGSVWFERSAFCGSGYQRYKPKTATAPEQKARLGDNIFTALRAIPAAAGPTSAPATQATDNPTAGPGDFGRDIPPGWQYDSYLLPSDDQ